jgi:hypothetical protein
MHLTVGETWFWIVCLLALEVSHLKWIWWERWHCRACGVVNHQCNCGRARRLMRLF